MFLKTIIFTLLLISSCQDDDQYVQLNTIPHYKDLKNYIKTTDIFIMTAHDISGQVAPLTEKVGDIKTNKVFKSGGFSVLKTYRNIADKRFKDQVILIGNGNPFNMTRKLDRQINLIKEMNFDVLNVIGPELNTLIDNISLETLYPLPIFSSNIVNAANGENFILSNQSIRSHKIIEKNGIKIGFINLSDYKIIPSTKAKRFKGIYFKDMVASTIKEVKYLREKNVNAIIVNINTKSQCKNKNYSFKSYNKKLKCPKKDRLKEYIERLPRGMVDFVIAAGGVGGSGTISGIPVLKEESKGRFLGIAKLSFDSSSKKLLKNKLALFPPIKTCHHFFAATNDCFFEANDKEISEQRMKLLEESAYLTKPAMFLGHEIIKDPMMEKLIYRQDTL